MTVRDLLGYCCQPGGDFQLYVNAFVDEFRRTPCTHGATMIAEGPGQSGKMEGLVAAVVSALCREAGMEAPAWVAHVHSPEPFFAFPARGFALRVRLMLESPPPFRTRNVFVPENFLARA